HLETRKLVARALANGAALGDLRTRAREARLAIDTAFIGTLHGFCHRTLAEFGFETELGQRAVAEAVQGADESGVDGKPRFACARAQVVQRGTVRQCPRDELARFEVLAVFAGARRARLVLAQQRVGDHQSLPQPHRKFGGGGAGEGGHHDFIDLEVARQDQAQVQRRDGEGLAGAGAGLDRTDAVERQSQCVARGGHKCIHERTFGIGTCRRGNSEQAVLYSRAASTGSSRVMGLPRQARRIEGLSKSYALPNGPSSSTLAVISTRASMNSSRASSSPSGGGFFRLGRNACNEASGNSGSG